MTEESEREKKTSNSYRFSEMLNKKLNRSKSNDRIEQ